MRFLVAVACLVAPCVALADPPTMPSPHQREAAASTPPAGATVPAAEAQETIRALQQQGLLQNQATTEKLLDEVEAGIKQHASEDTLKGTLTRTQSRVEDLQKQLAEAQARTADALKQLGEANAKLAARPAAGAEPAPPHGAKMLLECPALPICYSPAPIEASTVESPVAALPEKKIPAAKPPAQPQAAPVAPAHK